jgi:type I restriction enzyme R subunit
MALSDLIDEKSRLLLWLEAAKLNRQPPDHIRQLASLAADLEKEIARQLLLASDGEKAVINLVSEASCLVDAGRLSEAIQVYRSAINLSPTEKLKGWVQMQIDSIEDSDIDRPAAKSGENEYRFVERPFLDQLKALGWDVIDQGFGIPHDPKTSQRTSFRDVALKEVFCEAIRSINLTEDGKAWLTSGQLEELYERLLLQPSHSLVETNQEVFKLLLRSQVDVNELTGEQYPDVNLIDFDRPTRNHFVAINQFRIDTPGCVKKFIIPDVVLFVNGLPFVVVECKDANSFTSNPMHEAFVQLMRYSGQREETRIAGLREGEPRLFHFNQLLVRTTGEKADYGTITATEEEYFSPWNDIYPASCRAYTPPLGKERPQERLIQGMLAPEVLLDIIRHCTIFMEVNKVRVKVACRYQQYRAMRKIVERLRTGKTPADRSGVVWHTQGSGKSLTMVFVVRKLRTCNDLKDYKVVMVNDRTDLEEQLGETATLTGEKVTYIGSNDDLKAKLASPSSNLNMVMVHKFRVGEGKDVPTYLAEALGCPPTYERFGIVNSSERILVMIDEAHRTQSSDPEGSFSDNLFEAFPNATHLAFTGTPLITDRHTKRTVDRFGSYIDKYKMHTSVIDGATVQILYEGRTADTGIEDKTEFDRKHEDLMEQHVKTQMRKDSNVELVRREAGRQRRVFEDLYGARTDEEVLAIKKKYGTNEDIFEAEGRIKEIAEDLVEHYVENILPNGFKAQVVCHSKMAAIHYKTYIDAALAARLKEEMDKPVWSGQVSKDEDRASFRDEELVEQIAFLKSAVVVSSDGTNEKAVITEAMRVSREIKAVNSFKKGFDEDEPETGVAFLIVCSMLLTGFDAPIEQVMYIDKKVQEHNLLQTIARVNRVAKGKNRGYIVDYIGLANHLKEALTIYADEDDREDIRSSLKDLQSEIPILESRFRRLLNLFIDKGVSDIEAFVRQAIPEPRRNSEILEQTVELLEDVKLRADFEVYLKKFFQSMDVILPSAAATPYKIPARRFGYVLALVRERYKDETLDISGVGEKVRKLINEHLVSLGINPKIPPVELFSPGFITEVERGKTPKAKASEMEHAIRKHLKVHFEEDPALYQKLSEKLEALILQHKEEWEQLFLSLSGLRQEVESGRREDVSGLSPREAPFYDLIGQIAYGADVPDDHVEGIKQAARAMLGLFRQNIGIINFWSNGFEVDKLKGGLSDLLLLTGIDPIIENCDRVVTEVTALAKVRHWDILA